MGHRTLTHGGPIHRGPVTSAEHVVLWDLHFDSRGVAYWSVRDLGGINPGAGGPPATETHGLKPDGSLVVGSAHTSVGWTPFYWSQASGFVTLSLLDSVHPVCVAGSAANDVNVSGLIVGITCAASRAAHATAWPNPLPH